MGKKSSPAKQNQRRANVARRSRVARGLPVESQGGRRPDLLLPGVQPVYAAIIADSDRLVTCTNTWDAEMRVTGVWSSLRTEAPATAAFELVLQDLITEAARVGGLGPYLLLRGLAVVGPPSGKERAHAAAEALAAKQPSLLTDAPDWVDRLGSAMVGACHRYTDPYGEMVDLVCEFRHADSDRRHAFVVTIEQAAFGLASDVQLVVVSSEIDATLERLAADEKRNGGQFESITPSEAARTLRTALMMDGLGESHPSAGLRTLDAAAEGVSPLLVQRISVMDEGTDPPRNTVQIEEEWTAERRAAFVEEFLSARQRGLRGIEQACQRSLNFDPLRVWEN